MKKGKIAEGRETVRKITRCSYEKVPRDTISYCVFARALTAERLTGRMFSSRLRDTVTTLFVLVLPMLSTYYCR